MGVPFVRRHLAWICCLVLAAVGCGGSSRPVTTEGMPETSLNDVGDIYRAFVVARHKPPKTLKDLATMERMSPAGVVAVRSDKGPIYLKGRHIQGCGARQVPDGRTLR
jgi:hypothetical protein